MPIGHPATGPLTLQQSSSEPDRRVASYSGALTENRLRQELARAQALLLEQDLLIRTMLGWREAAANHLAGLTPRQRQIMELVVAGQPSKMIAAELGISRRTVENHRVRIMKKTRSTCVPALARLALAAAWSDASALPPSGNLLNTGGPDPGPTDQTPADWYRGSAVELFAASRDSGDASRAGGDGGVALRDSSIPTSRQRASVTNIPTPVRCRSK